MLFSIIVPIYNVEKYLKECVDSILTQTFTDYEIILVDDGSPDNCPLICDEYVKKDTRIRVVHKANGGLSDARNAGLEIATGKYIIFIDSDDFWDDKNALMQLNDVIIKHNPDLITWRCKKFLQDKQEKITIGYDIVEDKKQDFCEMIKSRNMTVSACAKAIKSSLFKEHDLTFEKGVYSEDIEWCGRLLLVVKTIVPSNLSFYVYRQRTGSITHTKGKKNVEDVKSHLISIDKLIKENEFCNNERLKRLLAEEFCNFIVMLSGYNQYKEEIKFIKQNKEWLVWATSKRSKILKFMLKCIGTKLTIKLIGMIR